MTYILSVFKADYTNNETRTTLFGLFETEDEAKIYFDNWIKEDKDDLKKEFGLAKPGEPVDDDDDNDDDYLDSRFEYDFVLNILTACKKIKL